MLILKEPLKLNCITPLETLSDSLSQKIMGNYQLMSFSMQPQELLHMMTAQPEVYLGEHEGGSLFLENHITNRNEIQMELVNQFFNRILLYQTAEFTYQDEVFLTTILQKLGIYQVQQFMRQLYQGNSINLHVETLRKNYMKSEEWFQSRVLEIEEKAAVSQTDHVEENYRVTASYYLQNEIYKKLMTAELNTAVYQYQKSQFAGNVFKGQEVVRMEQLWQANQIYFARVKNVALHQKTPLLMQDYNFYEQEMISGEALTEQKVLQQLSAAVLLHLSKEFYYASMVNRRESGYYSWKNFERSFFQSAKNTIQRFEEFQTGGSVSYHRNQEIMEQMGQLIFNEMELTYLVEQSEEAWEEGENLPDREQILFTLLENQNLQQQLQEVLRINAIAYHGNVMRSYGIEENQVLKNLNHYMTRLNQMHRTYHEAGEAVFYQEGQAPETQERNTFPGRVFEKTESGESFWPGPVWESAWQEARGEDGPHERWSPAETAYRNEDELSEEEYREYLEEMNRVNLEIYHQLQQQGIPEQQKQRVVVDRRQAKQNSIRTLLEPEEVLKEIYETGERIEPPQNPRIQQLLELVDPDTRAFYERILAYQQGGRDNRKETGFVEAEGRQLQGLIERALMEEPGENRKNERVPEQILAHPGEGKQEEDVPAEKNPGKTDSRMGEREAAGDNGDGNLTVILDRLEEDGRFSREKEEKVREIIHSDQQMHQEIRKMLEQIYRQEIRKTWELIWQQVTEAGSAGKISEPLSGQRGDSQEILQTLEPVYSQGERRQEFYKVLKVLRGEAEDEQQMIRMMESIFYHADGGREIREVLERTGLDPQAGQEVRQILETIGRQAENKEEIKQALQWLHENGEAGEKAPQVQEQTVRQAGVDPETRQMPELTYRQEEMHQEAREETVDGPKSLIHQEPEVTQDYPRTENGQNAGEAPEAAGIGIQHGREIFQTLKLLDRQIRDRQEIRKTLELIWKQAAEKGDARQRTELFSGQGGEGQEVFRTLETMYGQGENSREIYRVLKALKGEIESRQQMGRMMESIYHKARGGREVRRTLELIGREVYGGEEVRRILETVGRQTENEEEMGQALQWLRENGEDSPKARQVQQQIDRQAERGREIQNTLELTLMQLENRQETRERLEFVYRKSEDAVELRETLELIGEKAQKGQEVSHVLELIARQDREEAKVGALSASEGEPVEHGRVWQIYETALKNYRREEKAVLQLMETSMLQLRHVEGQIHGGQDTVDGGTQEEQLLRKLPEIHQTAEAPGPALSRPQEVSLVHPAKESLEEEILQELKENRERKQSVVKNVTDTVYSQQVTESQMQKINSEMILKNQEAVTQMVQRDLSRQIGSITDRVYQNLEHRLQSEKRRRGY